MYAYMYTMHTSTRIHTNGLNDSGAIVALVFCGATRYIYTMHTSTYAR
jgi:hypothetical protein